MSAAMTEMPITDTNAIISLIDDAIADSLGPDWNSFQAAHHVMQWLTDAGLQIVPARAVNSHHDLIEALREELVWHEDHDKAISKQPNANTGDNGWRRMEHQERIAALTAILTKAEAGHG